MDKQKKRAEFLNQWGNGLKLIAEELQNYPKIGFDWKEPGIAFRVNFTNKNFKQQPDQQPELQPEYDVEANGQEVGTKSGLSRHQVKEILDFCRNPRPILNIMELAKWKYRSKFRDKYINPLILIFYQNKRNTG